MAGIKKVIRGWLFIICLLAGLYLFLNIEVTAKQGVNYVVRTVRMPLYIKIIEFFDRDYQYNRIVKNVCSGCASDEEKVLALFEWTCENINRNIPENWTIMDDHVWYTIIRGYGMNDQCSDVFATLCNYTGNMAYFSSLCTADRKDKFAFSFVRLNGKWYIFDPYYGNYFKNRDGKLISVEEIIAGEKWFIENVDNQMERKIDYSRYFDSLVLLSVEDVRFSRANVQSPLNRLFLEIEKLKGHAGLNR